MRVVLGLERGVDLIERVPFTPDALGEALERFVETNVAFLRRHPETPQLYRAGVRYQRDKGGELWRTIPRVIEDGVGDCEDLAGWAAAAYRVAGVDARIGLRRTGPRTLHAIVRLPDGSVVDPSRKLGMGRRTT